MENTSGFYKKISDAEWWFAPNSVNNKDYKLDRNGNRENIDGWEWHDVAPQEYLEWLEKQTDDLI